MAAILEGMPSGLPVRLDSIDEELARRQQGFGRGGRMAIEKDKIEITAVAQFDTPQFPIGDHHKAMSGRVAGWPSVFFNQMVPGEGDDPIDDDFGDMGQVVAGPHQRDGPGDIGCGDLERVDLFENAQGFYLVLQVIDIDAFQPLVNLLF